jgi:hypothetical protein
MNSDLQLFTQPRHFKPHFYSGKIFEMLRAGIPILAVTRPDGTVANLLLETNAGFTAAQRSEQAAVILQIQFDKWRRGEHWEKPDMNLVQRGISPTLGGYSRGNDRYPLSRFFFHHGTFSQEN